MKLYVLQHLFAEEVLTTYERTFIHNFAKGLLKSVTRIGFHIDYVIMYLCKEEDKDNKICFWYACLMGFMSKVLF